MDADAIRRLRKRSSATAPSMGAMSLPQEWQSPSDSLSTEVADVFVFPGAAPRRPQPLPPIAFAAPSTAVAAVENPQPVPSRRWISLDCETTGFGPRDHIVELAGVEWVDGVRTGLFFASRCKPQVDVHPMAAAKNGLTPEVVASEYADAAPLETVLANWWRFVAAGETPLLIAHNAAFDMRFLLRGTASSPTAASGICPPSPAVVCTMRLFRRCFGAQLGATLDDCLRFFGLPARRPDDMHRAIRDAELAGELYRVLLAAQADVESADHCVGAEMADGDSVKVDTTSIATVRQLVQDSPDVAN